MPSQHQALRALRNYKIDVVRHGDLSGAAFSKFQARDLPIAEREYFAQFEKHRISLQASRVRYDQIDDGHPELGAICDAMQRDEGWLEADLGQFELQYPHLRT